jgi:hypothetical protein
METENWMNGDSSGHLTEDQLVAFLGHELEAQERHEVELHLARCTECRDELVAVTEILQPGREPRRIPWRILAPVAAAAAAVTLVVAGPWNVGGPDDSPQHRDTPAQVSTVPTPVAPLGLVSEVEELVWLGVDGADRYRLTLYDSKAGVLWKATTADTTVELPDSVALAVGSRYLWRLEARVGWDLWESSDLIDFTIENEDEGAEEDPDG